MTMKSGWVADKTLLLLFGLGGAPGGTEGGGLMPDPATQPRRRFWVSYGQMALQGHGEWYVRSPQGDEELLLIAAALLR